MSLEMEYAPWYNFLASYNKEKLNMSKSLEFPIFKLIIKKNETLYKYIYVYNFLHPIIEEYIIMQHGMKMNQYQQQLLINVQDKIESQH